MFNGSIPIVLDTLKQHYFIDRDGKLFRYVLNFMRTGRLSLPLSFDDFDGLQEEAKYYEIDLMVKQIDEIILKNNKKFSDKKLDEKDTPCRQSTQSKISSESVSEDLASSSKESAELSQRTKAKRTALILRTAFKSSGGTATTTSLSTNSNNSNDDGNDDDEVNMLNEEINDDDVNAIKATETDNQESDLVVDENDTQRKTSPAPVDEL